MLGFLGHDVVRENHIGDWGTPFGMLIEHLLDVAGRPMPSLSAFGDLNDSTAAARVTFDERSRLLRAVPPQGCAPADGRRGDAAALAHLRRRSLMRHFDEVYAKLGVLLTADDVVGESFYNPLLPVVVAELDEKGLLVENDGALCVFPEGFENRNGEPLPLIVRKSDGGYGYPATDLASVRDRTGRLGADQHRLRRRGRAVPAPRASSSPSLALAGYLPDEDEAVHVGFGLVLGTGRQEAGQPRRRTR